jgi:hypothetical protein
VFPPPKLGENWGTLFGKRSGRRFSRRRAPAPLSLRHVSLATWSQSRQLKRKTSQLGNLAREAKFVSGKKAGGAFVSLLALVGVIAVIVRSVHGGPPVPDAAARRYTVSGRKLTGTDEIGENDTRPTDTSAEVEQTERRPDFAHQSFDRARDY